jgi:hypothetical protein
MTRYQIDHEALRHVICDKDGRCIDVFEYMHHQSNQVNVDTVCGQQAYGHVLTEGAVTCLACLASSTNGTA